MPSNDAQLSLIEYYGDQTHERCGYCKKENSSMSQSMWAHCMSVDDYQDLIDRGWRRSGCYCYKPTMSVTCCPSYTIRCDVAAFALSKSQKKVIKKVNRFLLNGLPDRADMGNDAAGRTVDDAETGGDVCAEPESAYCDRGTQQTGIVEEARALHRSAKRAASIDAAPVAGSSRTEPTALAQSPPPGKAEHSPQKKAKLLRLERRLAKHPGCATSRPPSEPAQATLKTLATLLADDTAEGAKHRLTIKLLPATESLKQTPELLPLYQKYQVTVHGDKLSALTKRSFERFLVNSPFSPEGDHRDNGPAIGYGTVHQQYWLDERLIAVGVLDILPRCVSAVYFFYDPDYRFLSLGTYSSFRELELCGELRAQSPRIEHYYMGYYIHSCPKMRYKAHMKPSALLCPEAYTWHALTSELTAKLDASPYQRLNDDPAARDANAFSPANDSNHVLLLIRRNLLTFAQLIERVFAPSPNEFASVDVDTLTDALVEYGGLVGRALSQRLVFIK